MNNRLAAFLFAVGALFAPSALGQTLEHVFEFDVEPAYLTLDDAPYINDTFPLTRIVAGDILVEDCRVSEDFGSGVRFSVGSEDSEEWILIGFLCDRDVGDLYLNTLRVSGGEHDGEVIDGRHGYLKFDLGVRHGFTLQATGGRLILQFEKEAISYDMPFTPGFARVFGFGTKGVVRFFTDEVPIG